MYPRERVCVLFFFSPSPPSLLQLFLLLLLLLPLFPFLLRLSTWTIAFTDPPPCRDSLCPFPSFPSFYASPPFLLLSLYFFIRLSLSLSLSASRSPVALFSSLFLQLLSSCLPRRISRTSMRVFRSEGCVLRVLLSFGRSARPFLSSEYSPPVYKSRGKKPGYRYRGA